MMAGWGRCRRCSARIWWGTSPYDSSRAFPFDDDEEEQSHFETCAAQEWVTDDEGERHSISRCRACKAKVWWETTPNGRRRPMDIDGDEASWECHFDTCPGEFEKSVPEEKPNPDREAADRQRRQTYASPGAPYGIRLWLPDLELTWPCSFADVKSAFRKLALRHHPDMGGNAVEFIRIRLAYDALSQLEELFSQEVVV